MFTAVDHSNSMPLYLQVVAQVNEAIRRRALKEGSFLPAEPELCRTFGIGRSTLRRAMGHLESLGTISRRRGVGTVVERTVPLSYRPDAPGTIFELIGASMRTPVTKLLEVRELRIGEDLSAASGFPVGMEATYLKRERSSTNLPVALLENWLPRTLAAFDPVELERRGLEDLFHLQGIRQRHAEYEFTAECAGEAAEFFELPRDAPVLVELRKAYDGDRQYCYSRNTYHPLNHRIRGVLDVEQP
jgi:DNA-binding GntR family transcriptional regulator